MFLIYLLKSVFGGSASEPTEQTTGTIRTSPPTEQNTPPPPATEEGPAVPLTRSLINPDLFGSLAFGMSLSEVQKLGGFYASGPPVKYDRGTPYCLDRYATMMDEYVKISIFFFGASVTVSAVILVPESCERPVVEPSGIRPSAECMDGVNKIAAVLTKWFGTPRESRVQHPDARGYTDNRIWLSATSEITYQVIKGVESSGYSTTLFPMFAFEPRKK
ncbi:MAG: hypothetical protein FJ217_03180 [Ignavibacteria bacterium]|nr:hypothetical protein [Ignavibacteria bacterium]